MSLSRVKNGVMLKTVHKNLKSVNLKADMSNSVQRTTALATCHVATFMSFINNFCNICDYVTETV